MTKEDYIKLREEEEIPLSLFYEYYEDKLPVGAKKYSLEEFEIAFPQFMQQFWGQIIVTKNGMKSIDFSNIVNKVYDHFNRKFELV